MPTTNINSILKKGVDTTIKTVDYSTPEKQEQLKQLKVKSETALKNKYVNPNKLNKIIINV